MKTTQYGWKLEMHNSCTARTINPPIPEEVARKEMATAIASTTIVKAETTPTAMDPMQRITPILVKDEPSEIHITKIVDAY